MDKLPTYKTTTEHQRVYDLIWSQMPDMQKRTSSSWWFFILFPKGEEGYGPRQMMFSIATRVGERIGISDVWLPGLDLRRDIEDGVDAFPAIAVGWYCDGQQVYEDIVKETAVTHMSLKDKTIQLWADKENGEQYGYQINAANGPSLGLEAHIKGEKGEAHFEAWGDLDCRVSSPVSFKKSIFRIGGGFEGWEMLRSAGRFS